MSTTHNESPKKKMITILQGQPEDSSYEELLRELAFVKVIDRGLKDVEEGRTISNKEVKRQIDSWRQ